MNSQSKWVDGKLIKPTRLSDESPVDYYKRTRCCPDDFYEEFKGRFFCNPAHCHNVFDTREERDRHLEFAYSILD